jgi:CRP-like cAMP-binding protein
MPTDLDTDLRSKRPVRIGFRLRTCQAPKGSVAREVIVSLADLFRNEPDIVVFAAGVQIFAAGDPPDAMYVILEGEIDIRLGAVSLDIARSGDIVGEMALVDQSTRSAAIISLTPVRLARIDRRRFLYLVQNTPTFAIDVMTVMASRIRRFDAAIQREHSEQR